MKKVKKYPKVHPNFPYGFMGQLVVATKNGLPTMLTGDADFVTKPVSEQLKKIRKKKKR